MTARPRGVTSRPETSDEFKLEEFLPYRLSVAAHRVSRLFAAQYSEMFDLSIPELRVLATVGRFGAISPSAVGEWAAMDKVKVSRAAGSLVARGLLRQSPHPEDGRGRLLRLTRKGASVQNGVIPLARELEASLSQGLGSTEWRALNRALARLNTHVERIVGRDAEDME
ncbi:MAG TPA: MarR family winged helix-turn-helix transcriptional regulator [Acetobacteraceae bacterium]|nr:MarR family winged helix-turn-helix transcriptional regulator [Acetobacteraceae bacterium]